MSSDIEAFERDNQIAIQRMMEDDNLRSRAVTLMVDAEKYQYSYHFKWLGLPIIQYPQDMVALQEIIWETKPEIIVETGIARGGSLIFSASLLRLLGGDRSVVGVDIDIRPHNRQNIEKHPLAEIIHLIEGSSIDAKTFKDVKQKCVGRRTMIVLDSNHAHDHVLSEMQLYSSLVSEGCYMVVLDTVVEDFPEDHFNNRPWNRGNSPKTAVWEFMKHTDRFVIDHEIDGKLLLTVAPSGYLRCVKPDVA